jgi:uroporphyrinogen-III synthase
MKILVTRPAGEAQAWVDRLNASGLQAEALPLMAIRPAADPAPIEAAWQQLGVYVALMFVSGNAASQFFAAKQPGVHAGWPSDAIHFEAWPRCWATGPGTARALQACGVPPACIDAPGADAPRFDSEALWALVARQRAWPGKRVLLVRGLDDDADPDAGTGTGRPWLADQLQQAGALTDTVLAYRRAVPDFSAAQRQRMRAAASDGSVWLFSSSQAIAHLQAALPGQLWAGARAVATHPRIAAAARQAGFGVVCESRPGLEDLVRSIKSLHD